MLHTSVMVSASESVPVPVAEEMRRMPSGPRIFTVAVFRPSVPHVTCHTGGCESGAR